MREGPALTAVCVCVCVCVCVRVCVCVSIKYMVHLFLDLSPYILLVLRKARKRAKIRNRYNQAPQLTQDTNEKVTTSQLDVTNESQESSPFPEVNPLCN